MATYYLINRIAYAGAKLKPGTLVDDVVDGATYAKAVAAGALFVLSSDTNVAAAARIAADLARRGANEAELESIMMAGYDKAQGAQADVTTAAILQKREIQILRTALTNAVNGGAQAINIGAVLPANAVVVAHQVLVTTLFSGGSATAVKLDVGGAVVTAIVNQMDVFTGAATGALSPRTGARAQGKFSAEQLVATFTPDGAHNLAALTAGDLTVTVWFHVLP